MERGRPMGNPGKAPATRERLEEQRALDGLSAGPLNEGQQKALANEYFERARAAFERAQGAEEEGRRLLHASLDADVPFRQRLVDQSGRGWFAETADADQWAAADPSRTLMDAPLLSGMRLRDATVEDARIEALARRVLGDLQLERAEALRRLAGN